MQTKKHAQQRYKHTPAARGVDAKYLKKTRKHTPATTDTLGMPNGLACSMLAKKNTLALTQPSLLHDICQLELANIFFTRQPDNVAWPVLL